MFFIGIDLAWSDKNSSGVAIIEANRRKGKVIDVDILNSNQEIINYLNENIKKFKSKFIKNYEDKLDAIFCAYIAYYCCAHPEKCKVLMNMNKYERGYQRVLIESLVQI